MSWPSFILGFWSCIALIRIYIVVRYEIDFHHKQKEWKLNG